MTIQSSLPKESQTMAPRKKAVLPASFLADLDKIRAQELSQKATPKRPRESDPRDQKKARKAPEQSTAARGSTAVGLADVEVDARGTSPAEELAVASRTAGHHVAGGVHDGGSAGGEGGGSEIDVVKHVEGTHREGGGGAGTSSSHRAAARGSPPHHGAVETAAGQGEEREEASGEATANKEEGTGGAGWRADDGAESGGRNSDGGTGGISAGSFYGKGNHRAELVSGPSPQRPIFIL